MKKLVVGNWKMNPLTLIEAKKLAGDIKKGSKLMKKTEVVVCPPSIYLSPLASTASNVFFIGAQNAYYEPFGAYTGEVSFKQLLDFNVSHVIIGHSERRSLGGKAETDEAINKKVRAVAGEGATAILCIGESTRDRDGHYLEFLRGQVMSGLRDISKKTLSHIVIAYEPVWAIGGNTAMNARDVHETALFIRKILRDIFGPLSDSIRILYGGSVDDFSAPDIIAGGFVQGLLVGHESLKVKDFLKIVEEVEATK